MFQDENTETKHESNPIVEFHHIQYQQDGSMLGSQPEQGFSSDPETLLLSRDPSSDSELHSM